MCYSSAPAPPPEPESKWDDYWNHVTSNNTGAFDDPVGLFIELTRGCENTRCYFKCPEYGKENIIKITPDQCNELLEIFDHRHLLTGLFGQGDVTDYPFYKIPFSTNKVQINFHAGVSSTILESFDEWHKNILINTHSLEDAKFVNHTKGIDAAVVPVAKDIDWKSIFSILKVPTVFRGLSDDRSPFYITPDDFCVEMFNEFGIIAHPTLLLPVQRAFRPTIEKVVFTTSNVKITLRRCFRLLDSKKIILSFPIRKDGSYDLDKKSEIAKMNQLMTADTKCKRCFGGAWKYAYPEEIHVHGVQCYEKNWKRSRISGMQCVVES